MAPSRFCGSCGALLDAGVRFCQACGTAVGSSAAGSPTYIGTVPVGGTTGLVIQPKNPAINAIASALLPGLGSILNGTTGQGVKIMVLYFVALIFSFVIIGIPFLIGIWIWGIVDAYKGAQRWNAAHGIVS